ncbi:MAG: hypothetical protein H8E31_13600 [Planctomycetes bacterium]|nr:hypothetical protein [Planctomycetota bacterium]
MLEPLLRRALQPAASAGDGPAVRAQPPEAGGTDRRPRAGIPTQAAWR